VQLKPGLVQRFDLMAVAKPRKVRRAFRFYGVLGFWALIGAVSSLAVQHWKIAAITFATAVFSGFMWWLLRRSMRRIPETANGSKSCRTRSTPACLSADRRDHLVVPDIVDPAEGEFKRLEDRSFEVEAEGVHLDFEDSNWIYYEFDWTDQE
jgi:hypothetical protein